MNCICIENKHNNANFTQGGIYEVKSKIGVRCDWGNMMVPFEDWDMPKTFNDGDIFDFAMCKFQIWV